MQEITVTTVGVGKYDEQQMKRTTLQHVKVCSVMPKFHVAQNLLKTRFSTRFLTCLEQVSDMSQTGQRPKKVADGSQT